MEKQPLNQMIVMLTEHTLENLIEIACCLKCDMNDIVRLDDVMSEKNTNNQKQHEVYER